MNSQRQDITITITHQDHNAQDPKASLAEHVDTCFSVGPKSAHMLEHMARIMALVDPQLQTQASYMGPRSILGGKDGSQLWLFCPALVLEAPNCPPTAHWCYHVICCSVAT